MLWVLAQVNRGTRTWYAIDELVPEMFNHTLVRIKSDPFHVNHLRLNIVSVDFETRRTRSKGSSTSWWSNNDVPSVLEDAKAGEIHSELEDSGENSITPVVLESGGGWGL